MNESTLSTYKLIFFFSFYIKYYCLFSNKKEINSTPAFDRFNVRIFSAMSLQTPCAYLTKREANPTYLQKAQSRCPNTKIQKYSTQCTRPSVGLTITSHLFKLSLHLRHTIPFGLHFSVDAAVRHYRFYKLQQPMSSLTDLSHNTKIWRFLDRITALVKRILNESSFKKKPLFTPKLHLRVLNFELTKILKASTSAVRRICHPQGRT
jgi:hypothetical protein